LSAGELRELARPAGPLQPQSPVSRSGGCDALEAAGLNAVLRELSMTGADEHTPAVSGPVFDGLYEFHRRRLLLGREPT
jgi:hypothetical protein